ncbi:hypothetical protein LUZ60_015639 [Juncus effusus]|nr:hypothetical protein LUZ60_015639 [Juncus effusus]
MNRFNHPAAGVKLDPMGPPPSSLARYGSAPGSLLSNLADSVINNNTNPSGGAMMSRFYPGGGGDSSGLTSSDSSCRTGSSPDPRAAEAYGYVGVPDLTGDQPEGNLVRHSSLPAGFLSHLLVDPHQGLSGTKPIGDYSHNTTETVDLLTNRRLRPQWSFSRQDSLSQLSDINIPDIGESINPSWNNENNSIFSKRNENEDFLTAFGNMDDMSNVDYLQIQNDVTTCKLRAKRGCATHPRSIAERERRTRISKRLRKLQDIVPNMDKQTSTSDMLELAVQYIKDLQGQIQKLKEGKENCTCSSKVV